MRLRRYCVTVMDNWTPLRMFWTLRGAEKFATRHPGYAYIHLWRAPGWIQILRSTSYGTISI